jgi:hypothetical protein
MQIERTLQMQRRKQDMKVLCTLVTIVAFAFSHGVALAHEGHDHHPRPKKSSTAKPKKPPKNQTQSDAEIPLLKAFRSFVV